MVFGMLYSIVAGIFISLQSVFNTRVSEKIGSLEATVMVHLIGLIVAIITATLLGDGNFKKLAEVNKLYLVGGSFGVIVIFCVINSIVLLGASFSTTILLVAQLVTMTIIDLYGLFGTQKIKFDYTKPLGIIIMILGIIVFKCKG